MKTPARWRIGPCFAVVLAAMFMRLPEAAAKEVSDSAGSSLLMRLNTLFDYDVAVGYSDNAYLWSSNPVADGLVNIVLQTETRKEFGAHSAYHISSYVEQKAFFAEQIADELHADATFEYSYSPGIIQFSVSDIIAYEDYRISDDLDSLDSAGEYRSWLDKAGVGVECDLGRHSLEIGGSHRVKQYRDMAFDFGETEIRLQHYWRFTEQTSSRLICAAKRKTYDELQATSADGVIEDGNPELVIDSYEIGLRLRRRGNRSGYAGIAADYKLNSDAFADQDSYGQIRLGASAAFQVGARYAVSASLDVQRRAYSERLVDPDGTTQTDDFASCRMVLERSVRDTLCAYVAWELELRDSNFDPYDYRENVAILGLKQLL